MMALGLNKTVANDYQKQMYKREIQSNLMQIFYFFERIIFLVKFAVSKVLSILTIPFFIIGGIGAYNFFRMVIDTINNHILITQSIYFRPALYFLGCYLIFHFIKIAFECSLERKKTKYN